MRMRTPRRRPRTLSKTQGPKKSLPELIKSAKGAKNVLTGTPRPKRKPIGTPRPRTTTPKPPETRQLADMRRMSPNIDTRMKQLSIDRGRTKGAKSSVMDKSLGIDARMAALAKERRAKGQSKSRARVSADARKKAMASASSRRVRGNTAKPNLRGIASMRIRRRKSRI